jgi:general secretion pathway protein J
MTRISGKRRNKGFTLLEMVIAITLVAMIIVVAMGAMRLGYRSVASGEKKIENLERFRASFAIIDAQVQSAAPLTYDSMGAKRPYFEGGRDFLRMTTNYSIWGGRKGHVIAEYRVQTGEDGKVILFASESMVGTAYKQVTTLFRGLDRIYFEYFSQETAEEAGQWVDQWTDETKTPHKVRVSLVSGQRWISLIIPMRAEGSLTQARLEPIEGQSAPVYLAMGYEAKPRWGRAHG